MEEEKFISGYCRMADSSRTVTAEIRDGKLTEADCCYSDCPFRSGCPIAGELDKFSS